jgi:hypothetical protein
MIRFVPIQITFVYLMCFIISTLVLLLLHASYPITILNTNLFYHLIVFLVFIPLFRNFISYSVDKEHKNSISPSYSTISAKIEQA